MAISKNKIKYIRSLEQKKVRKTDHVFLAEGPKLVLDLLSAFDCEYVAASASWISQHRDIKAKEIETATDDELRRMSLLKNPQDVVAVFAERTDPTPKDAPDKELCLALDGVQDPGNLGTIIRIADWFGINHIFCSEATADLYNPKVIQSTMGSMARVQIHYVDLAQYIASLPSSVPVYGTFLDGKDIYQSELTSNGMIIMGNEGNGISGGIRSLVNNRLYIPNYRPSGHCAESLNVAVATAIACAEFRRRLA